MKGLKTGGRTAGTPNRSTALVKSVLERVFTRAFSEKVTVFDEVEGDEPGTTKKVAREVTFEDQLVAQIITLTIDTDLLKFLFVMYAGSPARQVEHNHKGTITLAQIVAGTAPIDDDQPEAPAPPAGVH